MKANNESEIVYNKTALTRDFEDYGVFPIGPTCPIDRDNSVDKDNQFRANIVFELPPSDAIVADRESCQSEKLIAVAKSCFAYRGFEAQWRAKDR